MLMFYFMFLFGMFYMTRNVEQIAQNRMMEALVQKLQDNVPYNLRDIPRVDYTEPTTSDEEGTSEASEEESEVEPEQVICKRRRDPNPIGRMIEEVD
jgi:hypothetical protein